MKHVYSDNSEIAHLWFNQGQDSARNRQSNFYFEGDTIYSYGSHLYSYGSHFPIARLVENKKGDKAVLFTTRRYGNTTAAHISVAWSAMRRWDKDFVTGPGEYDRGKWVELDRRIFEVVDVRLDARNYIAHGQSKAVQEWDKRIKDACELVITPRIRQITKVKYFYAAVNLVEQANAYTKFFGIKKQWTVPEDMNALADSMAEIARKDEEREKRAVAKKKKEFIARTAKARQEWRDALPLWIAGELDRLPMNPDRETSAYLRIVVADRDEQGFSVATSQGARFPLAHAIRAIRLIRQLQTARERRLLNESRESAFADPLFVRNGHNIHLGHYQIDQVDADGTIKAGCHVVSGAEFERFAGVVEQFMLALSSGDVVELAKASTEGDSAQ